MDIPQYPSYRACCCPLSVSIDSLGSSFDLVNYLYASKFDNDPIMAATFSSINNADSSDLSSSADSLSDVELCPHSRALFQQDMLSSYFGEAQAGNGKLDNIISSQDNLFPELFQRIDDDLLDADLDFADCGELNFSNGSCYNDNQASISMDASYNTGSTPCMYMNGDNNLNAYVHHMDELVPSPTKSEEDMFCYREENEGILGHRRSCKKRKEKRRRMNSEDSDTDDSVEGFSHVFAPAKKEKRHQSTKPRGVPENTVHTNKSKAARPIHLYQFLIDLLRNEEYCPRYINWVSRDEGIFRLVDSAAVAQLWGQCKNRENMTYEKMSRALRYYYENGILERVPNCRLQYRFGKVVYDEYGDLL